MKVTEPDYDGVCRCVVGVGVHLPRDALLREPLECSGQRPDFLVITAARDMKSVRAAMQLGTVHYLVKPFTFVQLEERLIAAQRYLAELARQGKIELRLHYGTTGRPEHRFRIGL